MKTLFSTLSRWLTRLRILLANSIFALFLLLFILVLFAGRPGIPDQAALILDPEGSIVEETKFPGPGSLPLGLAMPSPGQVELPELLRLIRHARDDRHIRLIVLRLDKLGPVPLARLQAIREALEEFKAAGKMIIAAGPHYSQSQYYLAACADKLFIGPMGMIGLEGFSIYRNYFKDALASMHVQLHLFRAGKYKAFAEPFVRNEMSPEAKAANRALLATLWDAYKRDIARMRGISPERLQAILDDPARFLEQHHGSLAELAVAEKLADQVLDRSGIEAAIAEALGSKDGSYPAIHLAQYRSAIGRDEAQAREQNVAIITASGMILDGDQPPGTIGDAPMAEMLARARKDESVKAVVLRIDSPGGSAAASEAIRSEILRLKQAGKPVVVSMGSVAASGGYWIAAAADEVWARPTSITGSIGAFGIVAKVRDGLERLGIHSDGLGTTRIAGGIRPDRRLPPELGRAMQLAINDVYDRFLNVVSQGRKLGRARVAELAEGRVWSGADARRLGLVDHLGSLDQAISSAARMAGIGESFGIKRIRRPMGLGDLLLQRLLGSADAWSPSLARNLQGLMRALAPLSMTADMQAYGNLLAHGGIWALCPVSVR